MCSTDMTHGYTFFHRGAEPPTSNTVQNNFMLQNLAYYAPIMLILKYFNVLCTSTEESARLEDLEEAMKYFSENLAYNAPIMLILKYSFQY